MRLTVLCVCGTLLAISSLSRITAIEGFLLEDQGFGPCIATLRPEGACRTGEHESLCPYRFNLPPFTIHLPQQLQEVEKIMQDLQKLKDSVDELREMCADCKVSQNECGRQREREHENLNEGKATLEDERNRMKVRHEENDRDLRQECGKDDVEVEKMDEGNYADKRLKLKEKDRNEWETDTRSNRGVMRENEREETLTEVAEKERKTKTEGTQGKDSLQQKKVTTAGANDKITDVTKERFLEENHKETESERNKGDAGKENLKGYQDLSGENGGEGKITTDVRNKGESDHHIWRNETKTTKEKTQTEVSRRIKIPENHREHTNKEQKKHKEEKRKEMKEGIIMDKNDKKPKQTESIRKIKKERTMKEGELDDDGTETGKEIKTENTQGEGDGELSSSKIIEMTDSVSIGPTLQPTMRLTSRPESVDSNKATIFTSSLPSPPLPSSTLSLITDVGHDTRAVYGPTQSTSLGAAGIPKPRSFDAALATTTATTTTVGGPARQITSEDTSSTSVSMVKSAGFQGHVTTTPISTTTHEKLYVTAIPKVTDHSRWAPKKNASSLTRSTMKPSPGQGPKPGKNHKSPIKPETKKKLNYRKNDRKPDQPLFPDKKNKNNQKQKPSPHKPKTNIHKTGKDSEQIRNFKPDQRRPTDILESDENLKNNLTLKQNQDHKTDQNKPLVKKTGFLQTPVKSPASQRPQTVNTTSSDIKSISDEFPITDQDSKPKKKLVHPLKTDNPSQKQKPEKKPQSEDRTIPHKFDLNENPKTVQEPEPKKGGTPTFTPKPNQGSLSKLVEKTENNTLHEPKSKLDSTPRQKITSDRADGTPDQEPKSSQEIPTINQTHKPSEKPEFKRSETTTPKMNQKHQIVSVEKSKENTLPEPTSNPDSVPGKKITLDRADAISRQEPKSSPEILKVDQTPKPRQKPEFKKSETPTPKQKQKPLTESLDKSKENPSREPKSNEDSVSKHTAAPANTPLDQKPKPRLNIPKNNQGSKPDQVPKPNQKHPKPSISKDLKTEPNTNPKHKETPQIKTPKPGQMPNLKPTVHDKFPNTKTNKTSKPMPHSRYTRPTRPTVKPPTKPIQRPKPALQPKLRLVTKTHSDPPHISRTTSHNIQNSHTDMPSTSGLEKQIAEVTRSTVKDFSVSLSQTITLGPKTSNSLQTGPFPRLHTLPEDFTVSPNSRIMSDLRPQTVSQPPSIPMTTRPNKINRGILLSVITSMRPGSTQPSLIPKSDSSFQNNVLNNVGETTPATQVPSPSSKTSSNLSSDLRSATPTTSGPEPPAAETSTSSARELRVKINQVAAFLNNSLSPNGRPVDMRLKEHHGGNEGGSRPERTDSKIPKTSVPSKERRDCSDHLLRGETKSGVYLVTPDHRSRSFQVFCDMELDGGGWTLLQRRQDGSVSFNRTWAEYQSGFGHLDGEFWLGNNMIHLLTRDRDMVLRVELEDFGGVTEYARYELFRVAGERLRYRLTVGEYSGTAGDALRFSKSYDHNSRAFTTPDRDNDRYPSGNCGAYYSSGWWFDACMAANLNGRYYKGSYKGVRDGIFWGTWHNISTEYYPTNERQSFKTVRMMVRPRSFAP